MGASLFSGWGASSPRPLFCRTAFFLLVTCLEGDEECGASFWGPELPPVVGEAFLAASGCGVGATGSEGVPNSLESLLTATNTTR